MTWPDIEGKVRTLLRADPGVTALVGSRVFFGVPREPSAWPVVTVQRVGGGPDGSQVPADDALIQVDIFGRVDPSGHGDKAQTWTVTAAIIGALEAQDRGSWACQVLSVLWLPDPTDDRPRYSLTVRVLAVGV